MVEAAIVGLPHPTLGEEPAAFVVLAPGQSAGKRELKDYLAKRLSHYKIPVWMTVVADALPRNAAGKVLKQDLRNRLIAGPTGNLTDA